MFKQSITLQAKTGSICITVDVIEEDNVVLFIESTQNEYERISIDLDAFNFDLMNRFLYDAKTLHEHAVWKYEKVKEKENATNS